MGYKIELSLHELNLTISGLRYIKAEFDFRDDKDTQDRVKLIERFERLLD